MLDVNTKRMNTVPQNNSFYSQEQKKKQILRFFGLFLSFFKTIVQPEQLMNSGVKLQILF